MTVKTKLFLMLILFTYYAMHEVAVASPCVEEIRRDREVRTSDFIDDAYSIAIYRVTGVEISEYDKLLRSETYVYALELLSLLKGSPPKEISLFGREPYNLIPEFYFGKLYSFNGLNYDSPLIFGESSWTEGVDHECILSSKFIVGYSYIVFNAPYFSRALYEPALDVRRNNFISIIYSDLNLSND